VTIATKPIRCHAGEVGLRSPGFAVALAALSLLAFGCEGDGDDEAAGGSRTFFEPEPMPEPAPEPEPEPEPQTGAGCEGLVDHPFRVPATPSGYVVACSAEGGYSLHVENVSSHVLRFTPSDPSETVYMTLEEPDAVSPGLQAAVAVTGGGVDTAGETFVLPLGYSLTAESESVVSMQFEADLELTAEAIAARSVGDWMASKLRTPGQAFVQRMETCATSAADLAAEGALVEDLLRSALGTRSCYSLLDDVLREEGAQPPTELSRARARTQILRLAQPALEDRLISRLARIVAHR
jgi:hypothetical protein